MPASIQVRNPFRAQEPEHMDIMALTTELAAYLAHTGHPKACARISDCDPWKYEPFVLDDLIRERITSNRLSHIKKLRELIRAGSCMTYPRMSTDDVLHNLQLLKHHGERPESINQLRQSIQSHILGQELEAAAELVENISVRLWLQLKQLIVLHAIPDEQLRGHYLTRPLYQEIEFLRPVRDLLYYRLLYPNQARLSIPTAVATIAEDL